MPVLTAFLRIPFNFEFCLKYAENFYQFYGVSIAGVKNIPYDKELIESILADHDVNTKEIARFPFVLDPAQPPQYYTNIDAADFYPKIIEAANKAGITLAVNEIKAIYAFANSLGGKLVQGGIIRNPERVLKSILESFGKFPIENDITKAQSYTQIKKQDGVLEVSVAYQVAEYVNDADPEQLPASIILNNTYRLIPDNEGTFTLQTGEEFCLINSDLWFRAILPAGLSLLNKTRVLEKEHIANFMPLITEPSFRDKFFEKLLTQSLSIKQTAFEFINIYCGLDNNLREAMHDAYANALLNMQKTNPALTFRLSVLETFLLENYLPAAQYDAIHTMVNAIDALDARTKAAQQQLLTEIVHRTIVVISKPGNLVNLEEYQNLIRKAENARLLKIAAAITAIVLSTALIGISIIAAVATFGASTYFSAIGVMLGTSAMAKALAIVSVVSSAAVLAGSAKVLAHPGLPIRITNAAKVISTFWSVPLQVNTEQDMSQTSPATIPVKRNQRMI